MGESAVKNVSIKELNLVLDRLGLKKTWHSILITHLKKINRLELEYIGDEKEFQNSEILKRDFIDKLSVGEISVLYEYSLAYINREKRKEDGQYFTPDDVAQVMAKKALSFLKNKIWIDPCSGIGNLSFWLTYYQKNQEDFLKNNLYLIDKDELALLIARFIFTLTFQKNEKLLFKKIQSRFIVADFLFDNNLPKYDYAILNPPYALTEPHIDFNTSSARDLYAYFLEKVIKSSIGFISITPQTFTNGQKFHSLRKLLLDNCKNITIYCFDNVPDNIFKGIKFGSKNTNKANSTRAGIIVAHKNNNQKIFRITPLLRWRTKERQELLNSIDTFLVEIKPSDTIFPKLQKDLLSFYDSIIKQKRTLADLLSHRPTLYKLIIPSTPRYFISALKCAVDRTSFKTLYFDNKEDMDVAYMLLNSSYMYWWWRVNDGGMTISEKTLLSLPIMHKIPVDKDLLLKIELSEKTNRVVKRNAGKDNENVKHNPALIKEITNSIFPRFASSLALLHDNSVI